MFARILHLCLCVFSAGASLAADSPPPANPAVPPAETPQKEMEALLASVEAKQAAALEAIAAAAKSGTIKSPEESRHRSAVQRAYNRDTGFAFASMLANQAASAPEPIAAAITELDIEIKRAIARAAILAKAQAVAAGQALAKIAENGSKPEELDAIDKQIALGHELVYRHDGVPPDPGSFGFEILDQLSRLTRVVLEGMQKSDADLIAAALTRFPSVPTSWNSLPLEVESVKRSLLSRSSASYLATARDAFTAAQRAIIDGQSRQAMEDKIVAFQKAAGDLSRIQRSSPVSDGRRTDTNNVVYALRSTAEAIQWLKNDNAEPMALNPPGIPEDSEFPVTAEYRAFVLGLMPKFTERRNLVEAREEIRRRDAERTARELAEKEAREALEQRRKAYSQRIAAADSPEAILSLANEFSASARMQDLAQFNSVQAEPRRAAACWLESNPIPFTSAERGYESHPFVIEMGQVRERVNRDVAAKRLPAPQLLQEPLATMPLRDALEQILRESAEKRDWKQSLEILRFLALGEGGVSGPANDRYKAVHSYLTGLNLEAAGQFSEAADAYLIVLRTVGDPLPMKEAAEQLKKLRATQPKASTKTPAKPSR